MSETIQQLLREVDKAGAHTYAGEYKLRKAKELLLAHLHEEAVRHQLREPGRNSGQPQGASRGIAGTGPADLLLQA